MFSTDDPRLDSPVYTALTGAQARFAQARGRAVRFQRDVAPFLALPEEPSAQDWMDAAHLVPVAGDAGGGSWASRRHADPILSRRRRRASLSADRQKLRVGAIDQIGRRVIRGQFGETHRYRVTV